MPANIGGPTGPFNEGQSIFDFLDDKVLNQLSKALAAYKGLNVSPPLSLHRGPGGDTISLQKRIDNWMLVILRQDLDAGGSAPAYVLRRDGSDVLFQDETLPVTVWDPCYCKSYSGQRGFVLQNPFSKNGNWEFFPCPCDPGASSGYCTVLASGDTADSVVWSPGTTPDVLTLTLTGVTNTKTCWDCGDFNSSFVLDRTDATALSSGSDGSDSYQLCLPCPTCGVDNITAVVTPDPIFPDADYTMTISFNNEGEVVFDFESDTGVVGSNGITDVNGLTFTKDIDNSDCNLPSTLGVVAS